METRNLAPPTGVQRWTYDSADRVLTETGRRGIETRLTLDGEGRVRARSRGGRVERWVYDAAGRELSHTNARGPEGTTRYANDVRDRRALATARGWADAGRDLAPALARPENGGG